MSATTAARSSACFAICAKHANADARARTLASPAAAAGRRRATVDRAIVAGASVSTTRCVIASPCAHAASKNRAMATRRVRGASSAAAFTHRASSKDSASRDPFFPRGRGPRRRPPRSGPEAAAPRRSLAASFVVVVHVEELREGTITAPDATIAEAWRSTSPSVANARSAAHPATTTAGVGWSREATILSSVSGAQSSSPAAGERAVDCASPRGSRPARSGRCLRGEGSGIVAARAVGEGRGAGGNGAGPGREGCRIWPTRRTTRRARRVRARGVASPRPRASAAHLA